MEPTPVFDERLPGLLLDAAVPVEAAFVSARLRLGYGEVRRAMAPDEDQKRQFATAFMGIAAKHCALFEENKQLFELTIFFMAINAVHVDHVLTILKQPEVAAPQEQAAQSAAAYSAVCSTREALLAAAVVLGPLIIAVIVLILRARRKK